MVKHTDLLYISPGERQCRVYCVPQPLPAGIESPRDVPVEQRQDWSHVATLDSQLEILAVHAEYQHLKEDLVGQMPGTLIRIDAATRKVVDEA